MLPLVSIIVPSFNQGRFIKATLDSILSQDYRPLEVIVVDGASKDGTLEVLHQYDHVPEVKWVSEPDKGVVDGVNKGFRRAQGEFAAIQSSDDYYLPGALSAAVRELVADPGLGFIYGDIVKIDAEGREMIRVVLPGFTLERMLSMRTWIPQPSTFFRLELARKMGCWREDIPYAPDTGLWYRMAFHAGVRKVDSFWAVRRVHGEQRDVQGARIIRDYKRMIETLPELANAPGRLRRAARAGALMINNRYGYGENRTTKLWRNWQAVALHLPLARHLGLGGLLPGYFLARRGGSWLKRVASRPAFSQAS